MCGWKSGVYDMYLYAVSSYECFLLFKPGWIIQRTSKHYPCLQADLSHTCRQPDQVHNWLLSVAESHVINAALALVEITIVQNEAIFWVKPSSTLYP